MKTGYDQHFKKVKQTSKHSNALPKNSKTSSGKKIKKPFPISALFGFLVISGVGLLFLEHFEDVEALLKKVEITTPMAFAEETKAPVAPVAANSDNKALAVEAKKVDDADYLFKLADRKKQLDQREEDLNKLAAQLEKQQTEILDNLKKLEDTRSKISTLLEERIKADDGKVETLVQMYSNMKPAQAAKVFESLDEDLVIEILGRMKKKNAADILNLIKPEKAQVFAERFTGYRAPAGR